jgi:hypothetical protein
MKVEVKKKHISSGWNFSCLALPQPSHPSVYFRGLHAQRHLLHQFGIALPDPQLGRLRADIIGKKTKQQAEQLRW